MIQDRKEYNGWTNWATWNVALWFGNDEGLYYRKNEFMEENPSADADDIQEFVREVLPDGTPDFKGRKEWRNVDWERILESWKEV